MQRSWSGHTSTQRPWWGRHRTRFSAPLCCTSCRLARDDQATPTGQMEEEPLVVWARVECKRNCAGKLKTQLPLRACTHAFALTYLALVWLLSGCQFRRTRGGRNAKRSWGPLLAVGGRLLPGAARWLCARPDVVLTRHSNVRDHQVSIPPRRQSEGGRVRERRGRRHVVTCGLTCIMYVSRFRSSSVSGTVHSTSATASWAP
jgi:hypothetical protein